MSILWNDGMSNHKIAIVYVTLCIVFEEKTKTNVVYLHHQNTNT